MGIQTFRERWTLFVGTLLAVALGVGLTVSSVMLLQTVGDLAPSGIEEEETHADAQALIGITLSLALMLSTFIISSTLGFTVTERRRELALLRLSGASGGQVRRLLIGEAAIVGLLGTTIGLPLALLLAGAHRWSMTRLGIPGEVLQARMTGTAVLVGLAVGLGLAVVSAVICSRRASRVRPLEALHDVGSAAQVMTVGRWSWGLLLLGITVAELAVVQSSTNLMLTVSMGILVIFTGSVALQQLSPLVVPLAGRLAGLAMRRHVEGEIAQASLVDAKRRTATTAGPVILLVGLVGGLFGVLSTQTQATQVDSSTTTEAQLVVTSEGVDVDGIRDVDGVAAAAPITDVPMPARVRYELAEGDEPARPSVVATDPRDYARVMAPRMEEGTLDDFREGTAVVGDNDDPPVSPDARRVGIGSGSTAETLSVVARTGMTFAHPYTVLVPRSSVPEELLREAPTTTMVLVEPGADLDRVREDLGRADVGDVRETAVWAAEEAGEMDRESSSVMVGIAGLGGLYALLSVINAVALGAASRKRELAVARVGGMTRTQVIRAGVLESTVVALIGVTLGLVVTAACLYGVQRGISATVGEPVLGVPWLALTLLIVVSVAAVAVTCGIATWMATRTPPVHLAAAGE